MNNKNETFIEKLYECNKHKQKLLTSSEKIKKLMPLTILKYDNLTAEDMSFIDQLIFRFSKLQDIMSDKLFPSFLTLVGENIKNKSFIDRLNRLEELLLVDKNEWMLLRKYRNEIAHEYSFNQNEVVDSINIIYDSLENLLKIYNNFYQYCLKKFEFVKKSKILNIN